MCCEVAVGVATSLKPPPCAALWHIDVLTLPKTKEDIMFEIIIFVSLYIGAIALLVKGAITYCEQCPE